MAHPAQALFAAALLAIMKQRREIRRAWAGSLGLALFGCFTAQVPEAAGVASASLQGEWVMVGQTTPLAIIPSCKAIRNGTTVKFTPTSFKIYADPSGMPCNSYAYKASNNRITFMRADMRWLATYELTAKSLTLNTAHFLIPDESATAAAKAKFNAANQCVTITLTRK